MANVIAFLASAEASFVTGANNRVDGGSVAAVDAEGSSLSGSNVVVSPYGASAKGRRSSTRELAS